MMAQQAASAAAAAEKPTIKIIIDYAKSPMVALQLSMGMGSLLGTDVVSVEVQTINQGPAENVAGVNMMSGMLSQMAVLLPLLICSLAASVLLVLSLKVRTGETAGERAKRWGISLAANAGVSLILSLMLYWVMTCVAALPVDAMSIILYCWAMSFCLMVFFGGLACVRGHLAAVVGILVILLGMTSAYLPVEALPTPFSASLPRFLATLMRTTYSQTPF